MEKDSFLMYKNHYKAINGLTFEQKGVLLDAIFMYQIEGEKPSDLPPLVSMAFDFMRIQFDFDNDKYADKCSRNQDNAKKRWKMRTDTNACERIQTHAKHADNDNDNEYDNDNEKENKKKKDTSVIPPGGERLINFSFSEFWDLYDKKVGKKDVLEKKWLKLTEKEREEAMKYIPPYKETTPDKQFRKNPESFLNQKAWNDEIITTSNSVTVKNNLVYEP